MAVLVPSVDVTRNLVSRGLPVVLGMQKVIYLQEDCFPAAIKFFSFNFILEMMRPLFLVIFSEWVLYIEGVKYLLVFGVCVSLDL